MPLIIKDNKYPMPGETGQKGPTGRELVEIENYFQLDGLTLIASLSENKPPAGYTKVKAMYSLAWISLTRAGEVLSLADVLNDYAVDDIDFEEESEKKPETEG